MTRASLGRIDSMKHFVLIFHSLTFVTPVKINNQQSALKIAHHNGIIPTVSMSLVTYVIRRWHKSNISLS